MWHSRSRPSVASNHLSCSCWFDPWIRMLSIKQIAPSKWSMLIHLWNNSGADEIPKGRQLKWNLPKGYPVINAISKEECVESSICQNPRLASILLKNLAGPVINGWENMSFSVDTFIQLCEINTDLFGLGTTTILALQSVGPSNLEMKSSRCILLNSCHKWQRNTSRGCQGKRHCTVWQCHTPL